MNVRNVGLKRLLYAISVDQMTIKKISDKPLDSHPDLCWSQGQTRMATQRANWLWNLGWSRKPTRGTN